MIDEENINRIIGDFLEVNAYMIEKREKSKFPKFISNIIWKNDKKKLLSKIENLRNSDYILNMQNISELSFYIYNNFDDRKYKSIFMIKAHKMITYNTMETVIKFDNITSIIDFDSENDTFDMKILEQLENGTRQTYNYPSLHKLYIEGNGYNSMYKINKELKNTLCDYIKEIISLYK